MVFKQSFIRQQTEVLVTAANLNNINISLNLRWTISFLFYEFKRYHNSKNWLWGRTSQKFSGRNLSLCLWMESCQTIVQNTADLLIFYVEEALHKSDLFLLKSICCLFPLPCTNGEQLKAPKRIITATSCERSGSTSERGWFGFKTRLDPLGSRYATAARSQPAMSVLTGFNRRARPVARHDNPFWSASITRGATSVRVGLLKSNTSREQSRVNTFRANLIHGL